MSEQLPGPQPAQIVSQVAIGSPRDVEFLELFDYELCKGSVFTRKRDCDIPLEIPGDHHGSRNADGGLPNLNS